MYDAVPELMRHQRRVAALAMRLARQAGADVPGLVAAALLPDVGRLAMLGLTAHAGPLTDSERALVTEHVRIGAEIARTAGLPEPAVEIILHHHEWWDGGGYPDGLRGLAIPLGARILAIVDAAVSMQEARSYARPRTPAEIAREISRASGAQFDPHLVPAALQLVLPTARRHSRVATSPSPAD